MKKYEYYLGIDVSKSKLDMSLYDGKKHKIYKTKCNDSNTVNIIIEHYQINKENTKVIMECTGVYHTMIAARFYELGYQVVTSNAANIKSFRGATGTTTKTDKADAKLIANYGYTFNPKPMKPRSVQQSALVECLTMLRQTVKARTQVKNRKEAASHLYGCTKFLPKLIEEDIIHYTKKIDKIWKKMDEIINKHFKSLYDLYISIPGVGPNIAVTIIAYFGEFENFNNAKQVQSFVGVCPNVSHSGSSVRGSNKITRRGNASIRQLMYMGAMNAKKYNSYAKEQFERIVLKGKPKKLGIIAALNKLLRQLFAIGKSGKKWSKDYLKERNENIKNSQNILKVA